MQGMNFLGRLRTGRDLMECRLYPWLERKMAISAGNPGDSGWRKKTGVVCVWDRGESVCGTMNNPHPSIPRTKDGG